MSAVEGFEGMAKNLKADFLKGKDDKADGGETKPLLQGLDEEKKEELKQGAMKFLYMLFNCCMGALGISKEEKPKEDTVEKSAVTQSPAKLGAPKKADAEVHEALSQAEPGIKEKLVEAKGGEPDDYKLKAISYRTQVTVGLTFFTKVKLNDGPEYIHVRIYKPIQGEADVMGNLEINKTESDEIDYF